MIFIQGNVPSSKNNKVWTGKFFVNSKATQRYIRESKQDYLNNKDKFLEEIKDKDYLKIGLHFVRKSKHKYDWVNPVQTVQDLMVKYEWIEDDNMDIMVPAPFKMEKSYTTYDKDNPGVWIKVM